MNVILNTDKSYRLSELAKAVAQSPDDLLYLEQQIDGESVSIAVRKGDLLAGILPSGKRLVSGGGVTYTGTGFVFDVSAAVILVDGVTYEIPAGQVTLSGSDPEDPRFDLVVANINGTFEVVEGQPPVVPVAGEDQVSLALIEVAAGATTPTVTTTPVYLENNEWSTSVANIGSPVLGSANFTSTNDPFEGAVNIETSLNNNAVMRFTAPAAVNLGDFANVSLRVFLPTAIPAGTNIQMIALSGTNPVGQVSLGSQGLSSTTTGEWQLVSFNPSVFSAATITGFAIRYTGPTSYTYRIDNILLQSGQQIIIAQDIDISVNGTLIGSTSAVDLVAGANTTIAGVQLPGGQVQVTITATGGGGGGGVVQTIVGTVNQIAVDSTDPANPVLSLPSAVTTSLGKADSAVQSVGAGTGISVDATDPQNPIVSSTVTPGGQVDSVVGTANEIDVDSTDPANPIVSLPAAVTNALAEALTALQPGDNVSELTNNAGYIDSAALASAIADFITESDLINTLRSFALPQWLDVAPLTPSAGVFTPNLGTAGSFTADWGANSTLADPIIPSGYDTGKVLAWDITFTVTGAGGWTMDLGSSYRVDDGIDIADILSNNNTTGDVVQLYFQYKNGITRIQPFIDTVIP